MKSNAEISHLVQDLKQPGGTTRERQRQFSELVRRHQASALRTARAILRDRQLAEDAVQEAWLECAKHLPQLRESQAFGPCFRRVIFKHCDRMIRRQSFREIAIESPDDHKKTEQRDQPQDEWLKREERRHLRRKIVRALRNLTPGERRLSRLRFIEERSYAEIARELQISQDTVRNRLRRIRHKLRPALRDIPLQTNLHTKQHAGAAAPAQYAGQVIGIEQFRKTKLQKAPARILLAA